MLGTTIGAKKNGKYSAVALTAFGERLDNVDSTSPAIRSLGEGWFTGKPYVEGLGRTFLMRNYRAGLAKWQTSDPMGYPDGWNQLAYCGNEVISSVDFLGCKWVYKNIFYFKKIDFEIPVLIPGGLPISVNPAPPTIVSALVSWVMDQFAQGIAKDVKPNWELIKYCAYESGYGNHEPSREVILNEIINQGYEDWEYVSDSFFWENHQSKITGQGEFVYNVTLCWKIEIRKWEE
jgi:RHS repeat-associated protein